jgi:hypothetical protein
VDGDVEVEARLEDACAEQAGGAAPGEHGFELRQQVAVFAAQVQEALGAPTAQAARSCPRRRGRRSC